MSNPTPTGQEEARNRRGYEFHSEVDDGSSWSLLTEEQRECYRQSADRLLDLWRAPSLDRGAEEWTPIADKPPEDDWIVYLPDGAADGLGWALDPDEKLAALLWWEATSPTLSEITHFRKPIAGPSALAQQAKGEGDGGGADG